MGNINPSLIAGSQNAYALVDSRYPNRWLDAWGDVEKYLVNPWRAADFTVTATGTSPITASVLAGSQALVTTGGTDFDGDNVQLLGSKWKLETGKPAYFGISCKISDATQSDFLVGLCGVDTTLTAASGTHALNIGAGGVFFSKLDAVTACHFKTYQTTTETNTATALTMDTADHIYEIYYDGSAVHGYIDGVLIGTFTTLLPTVVLTPSFTVRAGEAAAKTMTINWCRSFQVRS